MRQQYKLLQIRQLHQLVVSRHRYMFSIVRQRALVVYYFLRKFSKENLVSSKFIFQTTKTNFCGTNESSLSK